MIDEQGAYDAEQLAYEQAKREQEEWERRLSRYDEAIGLLRKWVDESMDWPHDKTTAFLAEEPNSTPKGRIMFTEITPEDAQRRYLKSMKEEKP